MSDFVIADFDGQQVEIPASKANDREYIKKIRAKVLGLQEGPQTLAGKTASTLREFAPFPTSQAEIGLPVMSGRGQDLSTIPLRPLMGLDKYGGRIKDAGVSPIEQGMDTLAIKATTGLLNNGMRGAAPFPVAFNELVGKPALRMATPFTPSEFSALGGIGMAGSPGRNKFSKSKYAKDTVVPKMERGAIAPKLGKAYMENVVPSSPKEIRHATRYADKTAADLVIERPHLGSDRMQIRENSMAGIDRLEKTIQARLDNAVKSGHIENPSVPDDEFSVMQKKLGEPTVLPSGKSIQRFHEKGDTTKYFTARGKSGERGMFHPESPEIEARQLSYLKEQKQAEILQARQAFKKRMSDPGYGYKIKKGYAIGRDEVAQGIEDVIKQTKKTGTEGEAVKVLESLKEEFSSSHPEWADVQYWNDVKRALHRQVGDKGYLAQTPSAKVQALKSLANRIKTRVEDIVPEIGDLNAEQGALLDIRDAIIESSPREMRDVSLTGPLRERAAIAGSRFLAKERDPMSVRTGLLAYPFIGGRSTYKQDVKKK